MRVSSSPTIEYTIGIYASYSGVPSPGAQVLSFFVVFAVSSLHNQDASPGAMNDVAGEVTVRIRMKDEMTTAIAPMPTQHNPRLSFGLPSSIADDDCARNSGRRSF